MERSTRHQAHPLASTERQLLELEFIIDKLADLHEPHDARLWLVSRQRLLRDFEAGDPRPVAAPATQP